VLGNAVALALDAVPPAAAGSASALLGAVQYAVGALAIPFVSVAGEMSAVPLAVVMLICATIAFAGWVLARSPQ
jgi:DHA1 family bicyclomycin/chloramphenicol resistance-like MFS transporter